MSSSIDRKIDATDRLIDAFDCRDAVSLVESASRLFHDQPVEKFRPQAIDEISKFAKKMKTKDPRSANTFTRSIDVLRESTLMHNINNVIEVLVKCRVNHIRYGKRDRERIIKRGEVIPQSPFNRRSASRGKLIKIDHNSSANGITTPLLQRSSSNVNGSSFSRDLLNTGTQATSVRNPLFETDVTPSGSASNASSASRVTAIYRHEPPAYSDLPLRARLGSVPSVPEHILCSELTGAMQGLEGSYFRSDSFGHMVIASTCALSHTQHNVVESFLSITNQFLDITHSRSQGKDMIVQAFLAATSCFIDEFILDLADIKIHGRQLSLLEMSSPIEAWRDRIVALRRLFALRNESGMNLLEELYSLHCSICENDPVISSLLDSCVGVFCRILKEWLTTGTLNSDEPWMIGSCSDGEFRLIHVPPFLTPWMAEYILKIGKSWQLANKDPETLDKLRSMVESEITPKTLYHQDFRTKLGIVLCEMCNVVCGSVVRSLMKEYHLIEHLAAVRTFLLVEDSHFSMALYNRFCEYTHGLRTKLSQRDASSILVWAITQSPARSRFPFQINIDTLSTTSDSPNTSSRMQFVAPLRPFYRAEGVVAQVFSGMEQRYEILFRFIWSIDMTRFSISDVIFEINPMFREWPNLLPLLRLFSFILSGFDRFFLQLRLYISDVINMWFGRLLCLLDDIIDIDSAVEVHGRYVDGLYAAFFHDKNGEKIFDLISAVLQLSNDVSRLFIDLCSECDLERQKRGIGPSGDTHLTVTLREFENVEEEVRRKDVELRLTMGKSAALKVLHVKFLKTLSALRLQLLPLENEPFVGLLLRAVDLSV